LAVQSITITQKNVIDYDYNCPMSNWHLLRLHSRLHPAPNLGGQGARAPHQTGAPHHIHVFSHIYDVCVPLIHFH